MTSAYKVFCQITKAVFAVTLAGFIFLSGALVLFSGFLNAGEGRELLIKMSCGGIYLIGSLFAIGGRFNALTMTFLGIFLNLLGSVFWAPPLFGTNETLFALIGVSLTLLWCVCLVLKIADEKRSLRRH